MWQLNKNKLLSPLLSESKKGELYNSPRQMLPQVYRQNAAIDVIKTDTILKKNSMTGEVVLGFLMEDCGVDIDDKDDWKKAEGLMNGDSL